MMAAGSGVSIAVAGGLPDAGAAALLAGAVVVEEALPLLAVVAVLVAVLAAGALLLPVVGILPGCEQLEMLRVEKSASRMKVNVKRRAVQNL